MTQPEEAPRRQLSEQATAGITAVVTVIGAKILLEEIIGNETADPFYDIKDNYCLATTPPACAPKVIERLDDQARQGELTAERWSDNAATGLAIVMVLGIGLRWYQQRRRHGLQVSDDNPLGPAPRKRHKKMRGESDISSGNDQSGVVTHTQISRDEKLVSGNNNPLGHIGPLGRRHPN